MYSDIWNNAQWIYLHHRYLYLAAHLNNSVSDWCRVTSSSGNLPYDSLENRPTCLMMNEQLIPAINISGRQPAVDRSAVVSYNMDTQLALLYWCLTLFYYTINMVSCDALRVRCS